MTGAPGMLAEFASAAEALRAARRLRELGYRSLDLHAPYELPGADAALGLARPRILPRLVLVFGLLGAASGYLVQWWTNAVDYPIVVGGRPFHALPAFVPITFEMGVLAGAFAALFGWIVTARLGRLWQPVFEVEGFERASDDRFWLAVGDDDPRFAPARTRADLAPLDPLRIWPEEEAG